MKTVIGLLCLLLLWASPVAAAATVGYVPMDDRPVNLEYVVDSVRAARIGIVTPSESLIAGRERPGDVPGLWQWVFAQAATSDALVVSTDSLIYGGLVASRTHELKAEELQRACASGDAAMVARANGVGPKLASRIVNELKDKAGGLAGLSGGLGVAGEAGGADMALPAGSASMDAVSALQNLGFKPAVASSAVAFALNELGEDARLNDLVRVALKRATG